MLSRLAVEPRPGRRHGRITRIAGLGPSLLWPSTRRCHSAVGAHRHPRIRHVKSSPALLLGHALANPSHHLHRHSFGISRQHWIERAVKLSSPLRQTSQRAPRWPSHFLDLIALRGPIRIRRGKLRHGRHSVKIWLLPQIPRLLPRRWPSHVIDHVGIPPQKMFVVVRAAIWSLPAHALESPSVHLPDEALVPRLGEVLRADLLHEVVLVQDLPGSAVGHP
mmetsp:Transcript_20868/g.37430  ORF Transcript_20868/g.37430 Transcript_20868/m.37430 type:complete len:221 (-) Transcript_20868:592-1254(-)